MNCLIYDFETLGVQAETAPVLSLAVLKYDDSRFVGNPYSYMDLVKSASYYKFDVKDQIENHGKKVEKEVLDWWKSQGDEAKKVLKPSRDDIKVKDLIHKLLADYPNDDVKMVFTRGNNFDPLFLKATCGYDPYDFWKLRDTRSYIDALIYGQSDYRNDFVLPEIKANFVKHDARHDVAADVIRMQFLQG